MEVRLLAYTQWPEGIYGTPEDVCGYAAATCVSEHPEFETRVRARMALSSAIESGHLSVLEHMSFTFSVLNISRACSHQLVRHRMASYAQQSQRYVCMEDFDYIVPDSIKDSPLCEEYNSLMVYLAEFYKTCIEDGIPEEDARYILPNACTTNIVVTMNARELLHFFELRCCTRAQWEIRVLANKMLDLVKTVAPTVFQNAGPQCIGLGYCPESRGCGKYPKKDKQ